MNKKETIINILRYIKKYWLLCLLSLMLTAISVVLTLYIPILVGRSIDCVVAPGKVDFYVLGENLLKIAASAAGAALLQWITNALNNRVTYHTVCDLRQDIFCKIQNLPLKFLDAQQSGEVISRAITDADQFADGLLMGFTHFFSGVITILATLIFMLFLNIKIALVVVLLTPLSFFVSGFVAKHTYQMFRAQSETRAEQTAFIDEMIGNQKTVHAFSREDETLKVFDEINQRLTETSLKAIFYSSLTNPSTRFVNNLVYAAAGLFGALSVLGGGLTVGGLTGFLSYANQYTKPFNEISGVITELQNALACASRIFELIQMPSQVEDTPDAIALENARGSLCFDDVSFSYSPDKKFIENLNLTVAPGQRVAIVGPTGCGKTTLMNLLMRFYDVTGGGILLEGHDLRNITRKSLRQNIGMVLQETWLMQGTVRDNIKMGAPNASDEEVIMAAKACHAHNFILRLPNGYDTIISEDGSNLSQGERQLLCIARVMLKNPPMLILDEATSSIDTRTEIKVQDAFARLMKGRTSFIVAHRLSTIQNADCILVMKDGNVIEQGTHQELLDKNGFYATLYKHQFEQ